MKLYMAQQAQKVIEDEDGEALAKWLTENSTHVHISLYCVKHFFEDGSIFYQHLDGTKSENPLISEV